MSASAPAPIPPSRPVALPEVAVPSDVFVLPLPLAERPEQVVARWLSEQPGLAGESAGQLGHIVAAVSGSTQPGEVAAFLSYRESGPEGDRLVGGAALLTLELLDPRPGSPLRRAKSLAVDLRQTADRLGHPDGLTDIGTRRTASGLPAVRLRFLAVVTPSGADEDAPMVEACRWLFPVPGHPDLAWSLVFQTSDIAAADRLVEEFDRLAGSLAWARPEA